MIGVKKMVEKEDNSKQKIIDTTVEILSNEPLENLTMRRIAKEAKVTLSSINYHFQSKENLIDIAIEKVFTNLVGTWDDVYTNKNGDPITRFRNLFKLGSKFIEAYPRLAKLSLLRDFQNPSIKDNTSMLSAAYLIALKEIYGNERSEQELKIIVHTLISAAQTAILREAVLKETIGFDMKNKDDREFVSDFVFDLIIQKGKG